MGDGWVDLAVSNHGSVSIFRNMEGRFERVGLQATSETGDTHGLSWADLDGDGQLELLVSLGAARGRGIGKNRQYAYRENEWIQVEMDPILEDPSGRGRCFVPTDIDGDTRLEIAIVNLYQEGRESRLARWVGDAYEDVADEMGLSEVRAECLVVAHLVDSEPSWITVGVGPRQTRIYQLSSAGSLEDVTVALGIDMPLPVLSVVPGDYDNDGDMDLYFVAGRGVPEGLGHLADTEAHGPRLGFRFLPLGGRLKGRRFRASDTIHLAVRRLADQRDEGIFLGRSLAELKVEKRREGASVSEWTIDQLVETERGAPDIPDGLTGLFLWQDLGGVWTLVYRGVPKTLGDISGEIRSVSPLSLGEKVGTMREWRPAKNRLYENQGTHFIDVTDQAGVGDDGLGIDGTFADLDNDGDLDLVVVNGGAFVNASDRLYLNNGDRTFSEVPGALSGTKDLEVGRGSSVLTFDFDNDGDLDLFLTNGFGPPPNERGPHRLFRNDSIGGNWASIELQGGAGNSVAMGALVEASVGGGLLLQELYASNGRFSTSVLPIHLGLGSLSEVEVTVTWPNGTQGKQRLVAGSRLRWDSANQVELKD